MLGMLGVLGVLCVVSMLSVSTANIIEEGWEPRSRVLEWAPNAEECRNVDVLDWCKLRLTHTAVALSHVRACNDIGLVDALQEIVGEQFPVASSLRRALWMGFENEICVVRSVELVLSVPV
tara:strand:+ start:1915 stop:2277 length:363 start_codon:yes stop_codon:yes gene_type:complete